ncbi:hypothetical protein PQX77_003916 [Marasmius sp. AFHP31]|nr:hypothetical protein PQX77_003916 [Marasmius sp. AFHP31]
MNLFPRLRRQSLSQSSSQRSSEGSSRALSSNKTGTIQSTHSAEVPAPQAISQRIHPDLNALAAQLPPLTERSPSPSDPSPLQVALKPWNPQRARANSRPTPPLIPDDPAPESPEPFSTNQATANASGSRLPNFPSSTASLESHHSESTHASNSSPSTSSIFNTNSIGRRFAAFSGRRASSPHVRPPSAWNPLTRRRGPHRRRAMPNASDFGGSGSELSSPSHSRTHSRNTSHTGQILDTPSTTTTNEEPRAENTPRSSTPSGTSIDNPNPSSNNTDQQLVPSPPSSSAFTFGRKSHGRLPNAPLSPLTSIRPALRTSLFLDTSENSDMDNIFRFRYPRTAVSMPLLSPRREGNLSESMNGGNVKNNSSPRETDFEKRLHPNSRDERRSASLQYRRRWRTRAHREIFDPDTDAHSNRSARANFLETLGQLPKEKSLYLEEPFKSFSHDSPSSSNLDSSRYPVSPSHNGTDIENFGIEMPSAHAPSRSLALKDGGIFKDQGNVGSSSSGSIPARDSAVTAHAKSSPSNSPEPSKAPPTPPGPSIIKPTSSFEPQTPSQNKGKRKADEVEASGGNTPPEARKQRATFANDPRPHRISGASGSSSQAPSSYTRKRARLTTSNSSGAMPSVGEGMSPEKRGDSRPPSRNDSQRNAGNTGSWSKASRAGGAMPHRSQSRASHVSQQYSRAPSRAASTSRQQGPSRAPSRRGSISQASIPISALISPHAPSISTNTRAQTFHMRDPRKPPRVQTTPWSLSLPQTGHGERLALFHRLNFREHFGSSRARDDEEEQKDHAIQLVGWTESGGSPLHAWLFFIGFVPFPVWWVAAMISTPKTRRIGGGQEEKKMALDDPQVEHDAKSWRRRCRIMAVVSLFTYVPFIVLIAIFARRR